MKLNGRYFLIILSYCIMFIIGFTDNLRGMAIPLIRSEFNIDYSTIAILIFFAGLGGLLSSFLGGSLCERLGKKRVFFMGYIFILIALFLMPNASKYWMVCSFIFLMYFGTGFFNVANNTLAGQLFTKNTALMMNLLHLFYGVGAVVGPKYAATMLVSGFSWKQYYFYSIFVIVIFLIYSIFVNFPSEKHSENVEKPSLKQVVTNKKILILGIALGFGMTLELATGNWFANYLSVEYLMNQSRSSFYLSMFFVTFVLGRLIGGFIIEKIGYLRCIKIFLFCTVLLYIASALLRENGVMLISFTGFFISIIFPTTMAIIVHEFKNGTSTVIGFIIALGTVTNMIFNWVIGKTNDLFGVYVGFSSFIIYAGIALLMFSLYGNTVKKKS